MSNSAMSNETDLDWLALNVHHWPAGKSFAQVSRDVYFYITKPSGVESFTHHQWLARRAEMQNKPSWKDHPDAKCFVQNSCGHWWKNTETGKVEPSGEYWRVHDSVVLRRASTAWVELNKGELLGDWRDTLEKRPEQTIADICREVTGENRHEEIFEPFVSIEDSQEKEMKQDNKWFERGELPPVGIECEAKKYGKEEYYKVVICGAGKHLGLAVSFYEKQKGSGAFTCSSAEYFRPIRTERDVLLSVIVEEMNHYDTDGKLADSILAAGFSLRAK